MASHPSEHTHGDPATAGNYDYTSDDVARPGLVDDLESLVDGEVRFDSYSRELYATDASAYEQTPIGVVMPESTADVAAVMQYCARREIPVLPRGGGTSLAGQTVNKAVVLDFMPEMSDVVEVDVGSETARAQAGIRLGDLNATLEPHGLKFAPDPAWGDKSALGGAIGNNSTGSHSLKYGKTDYYLESAEVVLADGTITRLGEISVDELRADADADSDDLLPRIYAEVVRILDEEADEIDARYPDLKRNVSGYNLDMLLDEYRGERRTPDDKGLDPDNEPGTVNLARLLAGSEGTLGIVTEATVSLEPIPNTASVALLTYDDVLDAMEDVEPILEHDPAAVEVMDDVLLDLARQTSEFSDVVGMLPEGTDSVLLVEFYAEDDDHGRQQVADLVADRVPGEITEVDPSETRVRTEKDQYAVKAMEAHDADTRAKFWKMRKSGLPILLSRTTDDKHIAYIEDTAIPAENLPAYVADFQAILDDHDTFASYYAHAGPGVLHIRPLVNTKTVDGLETFEAIADAATDLVVEYGGSVSGEHGDGRARTQWNRKLYGDDLWRSFRDLKTAFDPDWLLNPGNICGLSDDEIGEGNEKPAHDMTEHLRFSPEYEFDAGFEPTLNWENENGFQGMVELCHGCAGCRGPQETTGGVMCPTFRAAEEEIQATRGRANMLRQAMSGDLSEGEQFTDEFVHEVLDLCVGCKGCTMDCPSEVDMAKMKAEVTHAYHQRNGTSLRDYVFANIDTFSKLGSAFAPVSNWATKVPGVRSLMESTLGIAKDRELPTFHRETLEDWFDDRGGAKVSRSEATRFVLLFPDTYTNYNHPEAGKAAVRALEAAGVHIRIPDGVASSGRPAHSKGMLDKAREEAKQNVKVLAPQIREDWDVVVVEPSDAVMFQLDYLDLLSGANVAEVAANSYGVMEYIDTFRLDEELTFRDTDESLIYHGHCHQKSTRKDHHAVGALRRAGYDVDPLDSTCCGMAGSFGYEAEHLSMSKAIGRLLYDQVDASNGDEVVAPGASCRSQLAEKTGQTSDPPHPIERFEAAIR
ncbi:FAD-binding and (Fe-S)-binding domain-containing protein [Halogranum rubrum]|uniref:D-lactate dehydrogenase (cytochrome) n=1 Tax=Halogranum salarium B-1 TaxID=1210908 RepID=J3JHJ1_9EURY|nr:FAD-binding and (Fe-S)-binding domain-containing protein [Halogranum salarium]EJN61026.1 fad/fmn-dependent dehydrogenase [Halogranum salarium B-1]